MSIQREFRKLLIETFSIEEIKMLCFDLSIPYDDLAGDGLSPKINSLLVSSYKLGNLSELLTYLDEERPKVSWPTLEELEAFDWEDLSRSTEIPKSITQRITQIGEVHGDYIEGDKIEENNYKIDGDMTINR